MKASLKVGLLTVSIIGIAIAGFAYQRTHGYSYIVNKTFCEKIKGFPYRETSPAKWLILKKPIHTVHLTEKDDKISAKTSKAIRVIFKGAYASQLLKDDWTGYPTDSHVNELIVANTWDADRLTWIDDGESALVFIELDKEQKFASDTERSAFIDNLMEKYLNIGLRKTESTTFRFSGADHRVWSADVTRKFTKSKISETTDLSSRWDYCFNVVTDGKDVIFKFGLPNELGQRPMYCKPGLEIENNPPRYSRFDAMHQ